MEHNPIYLQLTRNLRHPSKHAYRPLMWGIAGIGSLLITVVNWVGGYGWGIGAALTLAAVAANLLAPVVALVASALITGRHAGYDTLVLVQLSGIYPRQIVDGYEAAVRQHLRWLRAVVMGTLITVGVTSVTGIASVLILNCFQSDECVLSNALNVFVSGLIFTLTGVSILAAISTNGSDLGVITGIWLGLTQRKNALLGAAAVIVGLLFACIIIFAIFTLIPFGICASFLILPLIIFGAPPLTRHMRRLTYDAMNRMQSVQDIQ